MSNIKQWSITKNIAKIRLDLQTVLNDLEYQNSGGRILYGVDNDVIKLYSNPEEKRKYARSFDDENENSLITNAYSLAEYIFKYLSEEPLLTLPTLYTESTYIFEYIWNSASMAHAVKKHQLIILKNLFKNYQKTQDLNQLVEDMLDHCDDLCRYFSHDKSSSTDAEIELQRISHLVNSNRLVNIQKLQWQQALPSHVNLIIDSQNWYDKLRDNHPKKPSYNLLDDAKTLAYVALVNQSFKKSGIKQKLYLITGDSGIHEILASEPSAMEEIPVRHPRIYRAFIKLFDYSGSKEELRQGLQEYKKLLDDFLSPFLLSCNGDEQAYLSDLSIIVENKKVEKFKILSDSIEIATYDKIKANRNELYNIAALNQNIINNQEQLKLWLQKYINKDQSPQTDLLIDIEELLKQKWNAAYADLKRIYIGIGTVNMRILEPSLDLHFGTISDGRQQGWQSLPIPLVSFGIDGKMDNFFENIRKALREENPKYATILQLLNPNEMYSIGKLYLVSALIATEACAWEQVKEFCNSALENAIEDPNTQHEAYYFQAIAIRHHCLNCKEYREAVASLRKAEAIWKENHEELSNSVESLRFQVERCNQIMAYYNYKRFITNWKNCESLCKNELPCESASLEDTWVNLLKLAQVLESFSENNPTLLRLKRQAYAGICSLFLFFKLIQEKDFYDEQLVRHYLIKLTDLRYQDDTFVSNYVNVTILLCEYTLDMEKNAYSEEKYRTLEDSVKKSLLWAKPIHYEGLKRTYFLNVLKDKKFSMK